MAVYPAARWVPASRAGTRFTSPVRKVVHHKTVVDSENAPAMYARTGSWPHFTVGPSGVQQHYDTSIGSRALKNLPGGVQTNADGCIQIEIVGMPGFDMPQATAWHLIALLKWLERTLDIPWAWPNGRPVKARYTEHGPVDAGGHNRSTAGWKKAGHFDHGSVPENQHWDTAYTDAEWWWLNAAMNQAA